MKHDNQNSKFPIILFDYAESNSMGIAMVLVLVMNEFGSITFYIVVVVDGGTKV